MKRAALAGSYLKLASPLPAGWPLPACSEEGTRGPAGLAATSKALLTLLLPRRSSDASLPGLPVLTVLPAPTSVLPAFRCCCTWLVEGGEDLRRKGRIWASVSLQVQFHGGEMVSSVVTTARCTWSKQVTVAVRRTSLWGAL